MLAALMKRKAVTAGMPRDITCPKGKRTRILHILSDSIPQRVRFDAEPPGSADEVDGLVEIERSGLLTGKKTERSPLQRQNRVYKRMFDARYAVFVEPEQDTRITLQSRHLTSRMLLIALGVVLMLGVAAGVSPFVLRWIG